MLTWFMDSHASSVVFSMPMCFRCSYFSAFSYNVAGTVILPPVLVVLSVIAISFLNLISSALMQTGMSNDYSIALIIMHIPDISSSLFVLWLCLDSQSAVRMCGQVFIVLIDL